MPTGFFLRLEYQKWKTTLIAAIDRTGNYRRAPFRRLSRTTEQGHDFDRTAMNLNSSRISIRPLTDHIFQYGIWNKFGFSQSI
jgi:hypothetical protein